MEAVTPELELQQEIQRFTTQFGERVAQASEPLERSTRPGVRDNALKNTLRYVSSALEIATGPTPEINLLDMFVFVRLCHSTIERHWVPNVFREEGNELAAAFASSDMDITALAARALGPARVRQLIHIVDAWIADNPNQMRVEAVRLSDFAVQAGGAAADRTLAVRGLLSSVKTATRAANEAVQLVERGLFLLHRLPCLWRLQARLGVRQVIGDSVIQLTEGPQAPMTKLAVRARHVARKGVVSAGVFAGFGLVFWFLRRRRAHA